MSVRGVFCDNTSGSNVPFMKEFLYLLGNYYTVTTISNLRSFSLVKISENIWDSTAEVSTDFSDVGETLALEEVTNSYPSWTSLCQKNGHIYYGGMGYVYKYFGGVSELIGNFQELFPDHYTYEPDPNQSWLRNAFACMSIISFNDEIYTNAGGSRVYRYDGGSIWTDISGLFYPLLDPRAQAVTQLFEFNSKLHAIVLNFDIDEYEGFDQATARTDIWVYENSVWKIVKTHNNFAEQIVRVHVWENHLYLLCNRVSNYYRSIYFADEHPLPTSYIYALSDTYALSLITTVEEHVLHGFSVEGHQNRLIISGFKRITSRQMIPKIWEYKNGSLLTLFVSENYPYTPFWGETNALFAEKGILFQVGGDQDGWPSCSTYPLIFVLETNYIFVCEPEIFFEIGLSSTCTFINSGGGESIHDYNFLDENGESLGGGNSEIFFEVDMASNCEFIDNGGEDPEEPEEPEGPPEPEFSYILPSDFKISPSVYSRIIDLTDYINHIPFSQAFFIFFSEKGEDNNIKIISSRHDFISEFGEPNLLKYGEEFGHQNYHIYNYLGEASSAYVLRIMPENANFSGMRIDIDSEVPIDQTDSIIITHHKNLKSHSDIETILLSNSTTIPICFFYPIGRGEYYNRIGIRIKEQTQFSNTYTLEIFEKKEEMSTALEYDLADEILMESFDVSFDINSKDIDGESNYIINVLEKHSNIIRCKIGPGSDELFKIFDLNIGFVSVNLDGTLTDDRQDFLPWKKYNDMGSYIIHVSDERGYQMWGWIGNISNENSTIEVFKDQNLIGRGWNIIQNSLLNTFDLNSKITYQVRKRFGFISDAFNNRVISLKHGSDGGLRNLDGTINNSIATNLLIDAFNGNIYNPKDNLDISISDTDFFDFSLIFDGCFPSEVKEEMVKMTENRRDCVLLLDNGINNSAIEGINKRKNIHNYNTNLAILYEGWCLVYDEFTRKDIWVSPLYHLSYLIPRNDEKSGVWGVVSGLNRVMIDDIKKLKYNTNETIMQDISNNNLNPLIKIRQGHTIWGQLTTQKKKTILQNLNNTRVYLYVKKALEGYCRSLIFEHSLESLMSEATNIITDFLESIKKLGGIKGYDVKCLYDKYQLKRNEFSVNVDLEFSDPTEIIRLNLFVK